MSRIAGVSDDVWAQIPQRQGIETLHGSISQDEQLELRTDAFSKFALLPKELRLVIWSFAMGPRVIPLHRSRDRTTGRVSYYYPTFKPTIAWMALNTYPESLEIIRRTCPEATVHFERRYLDWEVWDVRKNRLGIPYCPESDIVYFSGSINASMLLDFAAEFPLESLRMQVLALPGYLSPPTSSRFEVIEALHVFSALRKVIIVSGNVDSSRKNHALWNGEGDLYRPKDHWALPGRAIEALQQLKREKWGDWKLPQIFIVGSQDSIKRHLIVD